MGDKRRAQRVTSDVRDEQVVANGLRLVIRELKAELHEKNVIIIAARRTLAQQDRLIAIARSEVRKNSGRREWNERFARVRMGGPNDTRIRITRSVFRWYQLFSERWS